jgi:4-aminobutyrate aminotransferase-like enzyme
MATPGQAATVVEALRHDGVLIGTTGPDGNILKIRPPLPIGEAEVDLVLRCLDEALGDPTGAAAPKITTM